MHGEADLSSGCTIVLHLFFASCLLREKLKSASRNRNMPRVRFRWKRRNGEGNKYIYYMRERKQFSIKVHVPEWPIDNLRFEKPTVHYSDFKSGIIMLLFLFLNPKVLSHPRKP